MRCPRQRRPARRELVLFDGIVGLYRTAGVSYRRRRRRPSMDKNKELAQVGGVGKLSSRMRLVGLLLVYRKRLAKTGLLTWMGYWDEMDQESVVRATKMEPSLQQTRADAANFCDGGRRLVVHWAHC
jgi:hypothetical protein